MRLLAPFTFALALAMMCAAHAAPITRDDQKRLDAPPAGLAPTTTRLSTILQSHAQASEKSVVEDWAFVDTGLAGAEHLERSGTDYHSRIVTGTLVQQFGQFRGKRWHQDANGFTTETSDIDDLSFTAVRVREDAADPKNDVKVLGITQHTNPAYVVEVHRAHYAHPEWVYYDQKTGNITRVELVNNKMRVIETYDDFRTVDGVTQAWHVHDSYPDKVWDDDWHITAFHAGATIPDSAFMAPANAPHVTTAATRQKIGEINDEGYGIVRVMVNGRGLDFELDCSERNSYIDRDVALSMGLPTFGKSIQLSDGQNIAYDTMLPSVDIGPIHYDNFVVRSIPLAYRSSLNTKVVGYLGYDFFANNVIHIDYTQKLIEVIPNQEFSGDKPIENGLDIPFSIDNGRPFVPMIIGDGFTERVIVNNDLPTTLVFGPFQEAHADQFQDMEEGKHRSEAVPFADETNFGQQAEIWWSRTPTLRFAIADYQNLEILTTNFPYDTSGRDVDAMLGLDYLHYFDLYFDFPHDRFLVKPNRWFYNKFKKNADLGNPQNG